MSNAVNPRPLFLVAPVSLCLFSSTRAQPGASPDPRAHHQVVYHGGDDRAYLVGGSTRRDPGYHYFDDVWSWTGAAWTRVGSLPFPRSSHRVVYHAGRNSLVLFGGGSGRTFAADSALWEWRGLGWEKVGESPDGGLAEPGMCYDAKRERIVVFGGWDRANQFSNATWEWTGEAIVRPTTTGPPARAGHAMAYDLVRQRCLLFGGRGDVGLLSDTWEWDGLEWRRIEAPGPSPRWFFGMATDHSNTRIVLFGGGNADEQGLGDTWAWNGELWERLSEDGPPARGSAGLAFDGRSVILFSGRAGRAQTPEGLRDLNDTWELRGRSWTRRR